MHLIDDIDSFEPKAAKILTQGLSPICDHADWNEGIFCCLNCQNHLFDKKDLVREDRTFYMFKSPIDNEGFSYWFDASLAYPRVAIDCKYCGFYLGFISESTPLGNKTFHIQTRNVFLQLESTV